LIETEVNTLKSKVSPAMDVKCISCLKSCGQLDTELCFYKSDNNPKNVQLIVKPELVLQLKGIKFGIIRDEKSKNRIQCLVCTAFLGVECPHGPDRCSYYAFKHDRLFVGSIIPTSKLKWHTVLHNFPNSLVVDFFGRNVIHVDTYGRGPIRELSLPNDISEIENFRHEELLHSDKFIKPCQQLAYVETLIRDTIVVMPTGSGKTLAASLVMHRFSRLNRLRTAVMVVDRVPLVFQQQVAIRRDTGMTVLPICGENKTRRKVAQWVDCAIDAVVVTAGCLNVLLDEGSLSLDMFSVIVFDECHNAIGDHTYSSLLAKLSCMGHQSRPRIMGLSASPFKCDSFRGALSAKESLSRRFLGASYCQPDLTRQSAAVEWKVVNLNPEIRSSRAGCHIV
jgi:hypothetical protein